MKRKKHPNMLAGDRHFGAKTAQPSRVFREAVAWTVEQITRESASRIAQGVDPEQARKEVTEEYLAPYKPKRRRKEAVTK